MENDSKSFPLFLRILSCLVGWEVIKSLYEMLRFGKLAKFNLILAVKVLWFRRVVVDCDRGFLVRSTFLRGLIQCNLDWDTYVWGYPGVTYYVKCEWSIVEGRVLFL